MMVSRHLNQDWSFSQADKPDEWIPTSEFPTTVHVELLKQKKIPDPFVGLNEWEVQWIGEVDWVFKTTFNVTKEELSNPNVDLVFDGLDTFATVKLNGHEILKTSNQFVAHRVPVKTYLSEERNELSITFESAFIHGRKIEKELGKLALWNGDSSRLYVRKAQYNYGWDWGPILMTVGPWKAISLHSYKVRITDIDARPHVSESLQASLSVEVSLSHDAKTSIRLLNPTGSLITGSEKVSSLPASQERFEANLTSDSVQLWYPVGYGKQPLYTLEVTITDEDGNVQESVHKKIGFRRARIVEEKLVDQEGLTFLFEINNIRIFCGGSNWIPADSFLTTINAERYRAWLQLLVDGNQNMIRVWGGGIYEADVFYEACDELGILVWQDFMFGCGQYPAHKAFRESVKVEAEQAVKRLRDHPSVVIFAGNNEDYQIAESLNLELDYSDETGDFLNTNFPARYIYERLLPSVVNELSDIHYHRGSPYSGHGKPTPDRTFGDLHQWNVWHGTQQPWRNWDILAGRFVSEFGMQGYPDIRTIDHWLDGDVSQRYPQSRVCANHNKADGFERRLELYLVENFKHAFDIESYIYYTQIMQAECLAAAYRLWRRNWKGKGREYTAGALVWQINDCWPTTSWAIADYFLRPKPAFYTIARELRPFTVGMTRKEITTYANDLSAASLTIDTLLEIWGTNSTLVEKTLTLQVTSFDLDSDWTESWSKEVVLAPNSATELFKGDLPGQPQRKSQSQVPKAIIVSARLLDEQGQVLGRYSNWPEPFKFIKFPPVEQLGLEVIVQSDDTVRMTTKKPVKGIILQVEGEYVRWGDQAIDLVPGDPQIIAAPELGGRKVQVRYLGDGSA